MDENEVTGTCANGVCTVHGPGGKAEYSEVFEKFVPAFFAGAQVTHHFAFQPPLRKHEHTHTTCKRVSKMFHPSIVA